MKYNTKSISEMEKHSGKYHWLGSAGLFMSVEVGYIFLFSPNDWDMGKTFMACFIMIMLELSYIFLFLKIRRLLAHNPIKQMFFQSIFFNFGIVLNLFLGLPFILNAYWNNSVLFGYYLYGLLVIFVLALLYVIQLDCKQLIENSLNHKKKDAEVIIFIPSHVFYPLNKCSAVIYIPYLIAAGYLVYAQSDYIMTVGALIVSALFMYSEFCYFLLWIKCRLSKQV